MRIYGVSERASNLTENLVRIWENSVRATHLFLSDDEIKQIKSYVPQALNEFSHLIIAKNEGNAAAFMGCENGRIEMLFLAPSARGKGLGKALVQYGVCTLTCGKLPLTGKIRRLSAFIGIWALKPTGERILTSRETPIPFCI